MITDHLIKMNKKLLNKVSKYLKKSEINLVVVGYTKNYEFEAKMSKLCEETEKGKYFNL